jgi:hypothetical protein
MDTRDQHLGKFQLWLNEQSQVEQDRFKRILAPVGATLDREIDRIGRPLPTAFSNFESVGFSFSAPISEAMAYFMPEIRDLFSEVWRASQHPLDETPTTLLCHLRRVRGEVGVLDRGFSENEHVSIYETIMEFDERSWFGSVSAGFDQIWNPKLTLSAGNELDRIPGVSETKLTEWSKALGGNAFSRAHLVKECVISSLALTSVPTTNFFIRP